MNIDPDEALAAFEIVGLWLWTHTVYYPLYVVSSVCRVVDGAAYRLMRWTAPVGVCELLDEESDE